MTIRSQDLRNGQPTGAIATIARLRRRKSTIIRAQTLEYSRPWFERLVALVLLALSFAGTIAVLNGGWGPTMARQFGPGAIVAVVAQALFTYAEWAYKYDRFDLYLAALLFDAVLTALGYFPLIAPAVYAVLGALRIAGQTADVLSWSVIGVAAILLAVAPETILVDND